MPSNFGVLLIFGSGETLPVGRKIQRKLLRSLPFKQNVAILETPAGFQPNSALVAKEIADMFKASLGEFVMQVDVVSARKKLTNYSPDNPKIIAPLTLANYIFLGPGSPTYALSQLRDSKALELIVDRWKKGATLALSSAAALAFGEFTLPVYEIYKVGYDLFWEKGLDVLRSVGLEITIVTHWNNKEGGTDLDTSCCYMGKNRFDNLRKILPENHQFLCIDEHTAIIFDFEQQIFWVEGKGVVRLLKGKQQIVFERNVTYAIESFSKVLPIVKEVKRIVYQKRKLEKASIKAGDLPADIRSLLKKREEARRKGDFQEADKLRNDFKKKGYIVEDADSGQKVFIG